MNKTINKYLLEGKVNNDVKSITSIIQKGKTTNITVDNKTVKVTNAAGMLIFEYPNDMFEFTMNLVTACDKLKLKYQQIGIRGKGNMKFMIEL